MIILLFNWFGYRMVLNYFQQQADHRLEARIDFHDYDESQLIELRVALNMPYQVPWTEFERHYGEITIEGKHYTYVKRKIEDGFLVLKCIANTQKDKLEYNKAVVDVNNNNDQQNGTPYIKVIKSISTDFDNDQYNIQLRSQAVSGVQHIVPASPFIPPGVTTICEQPPDLTSLS